jgi:ADP-heptose:LPS heptosyltransferase
MNRFLIIQTAFIGDVILATPVIEALHTAFPNTTIDFLLRKGNEGLFQDHPLLSEVIIWDKKAGKYMQMRKIIQHIRSTKYDSVINLQRFMSTGIITALSGAKQTIGFSKNPMSAWFTKCFPHIIDTSKGQVHEVDRNLSLVTDLTGIKQRINPKLYPTKAHFEKVAVNQRYITVSPTSVWFTKQYPLTGWVSVIDKVSKDTRVFLLGGGADKAACEEIKQLSTHKAIEVLAGQLSFLESAALMKGAFMNYVNDSAPMHLASAVDAPVTAVYCSTIPAFGFGPLSSNSHIAETYEILDCRPCGLHGYRQCPKGHFKCSNIKMEAILGNEMR